MGDSGSVEAHVRASRQYTRIGMAAACVLSVIAAIRLGSLVAQLPSRAVRNDYSIYYTSGYILRHGENPYTTGLTEVGAGLGLVSRIAGATDPPTFLLMLEPLT